MNNSMPHVKISLIMLASTLLLPHNCLQAAATTTTTQSIFTLKNLALTTGLATVSGLTWWLLRTKSTKVASHAPKPAVVARTLPWGMQDYSEQVLTTAFPDEGDRAEARKAIEDSNRLLASNDIAWINIPHPNKNQDRGLLFQTPHGVGIIVCDGNGTKRDLEGTLRLLASDQGLKEADARRSIDTLIDQEYVGDHLALGICVQASRTIPSERKHMIPNEIAMINTIEGLRETKISIGTTMSMVYPIDNQGTVRIVNVGDSFVGVLKPDGSLTVLTRKAPASECINGDKFTEAFVEVFDFRLALGEQLIVGSDGAINPFSSEFFGGDNIINNLTGHLNKVLLTNELGNIRNLRTFFAENPDLTTVDRKIISELITRLAGDICTKVLPHHNKRHRYYSSAQLFVCDHITKITASSLATDMLALYERFVTIAPTIPVRDRATRFASLVIYQLIERRILSRIAFAIDTACIPGIPWTEQVTIYRGMIDSFIKQMHGWLAEVGYTDAGDIQTLFKTTFNRVSSTTENPQQFREQFIRSLEDHFRGISAQAELGKFLHRTTRYDLADKGRKIQEAMPVVRLSDDLLLVVTSPFGALPTAPSGSHIPSSSTGSPPVSLSSVPRVPRASAAAPPAPVAVPTPPAV